MITLLDTATADLDLTTTQAVLTHTPSATAWRHCQVLVMAGSVAKPLDGTGGFFEVTLSVAGQVHQPGPSVRKVTAAATRAALETAAFLVPPGAEVIASVKSPNAGDSDVAVTAYLIDLGATALAAIIEDLDDIKGTAFVKDTHSLTNAASGDTINISTETTITET